MIVRKTFNSVFQNNSPCVIVSISIDESRLILPWPVQYKNITISFIINTSKRYIFAYAYYVHFLTTYKSIFFYVSEFDKFL